MLSAVCARSPLRALRRSDTFVGFYFGGRLDEPSLATVLGRLPAGGTVELMCHPGGDDSRAAEGYWVVGATLTYLDRNHVEHKVPVSDVDEPFGRQLNAERNVHFDIPK